MILANLIMATLGIVDYGASLILLLHLLASNTIIKYMRRGDMLRLLLLLSCVAVFACGKPKTEIKKEAPEDISDLKARIDDLNNRVYVLTEQLESIKSKRSSTVEQEKPEKIQKADKLEKTASKSAADTKTNNYVVQEKEYTAAYNLFKDGQYAKALIAFSTFADKYPSSALTDNAIYWMGESYYKQKEYALAIEEYSKVLKKFPKESKAPYAMYRTALCYNLLGEKSDSEAYVQELMARYPNSQAAQDAKNDVELKK